jgi:hypothetical protein
LDQALLPMKKLHARKLAVRLPGQGKLPRSAACLKRHILMVPSSLPEASQRPRGSKATL